MKVFTVCSDYTKYGEGYTEPEAVFSTRKLAEDYKLSRQKAIAGDYEISEYEIDKLVTK